MSNMVINTNVLALNAHRNMGRVGGQQARASERLSSGLRINSAADDAAGLAISENMRSQINGLNQASRNGQDGISLLQTAEGGLTEIQNMVQRTRELTVQAANDTNTASDRAMIANEIDQLAEEVEAMAQRVEFNSMNVLSMGGDVDLQIGANSGQTIRINFDFELFNPTTTVRDTDGLWTIGAADNSIASQMRRSSNAVRGVNITTTVPTVPAVATVSTPGGTVTTPGTPSIPGTTTSDNNATAASINATLNGLDTAIASVSESRARLGASQNRVEYTVSSLDISSENLSASESRIRDADMGAEMMRMTQANVLQQAAMSMLSQANQAPQSVLQLLR